MDYNEIEVQDAEIDGLIDEFKEHFRTIDALIPAKRNFQIQKCLETAQYLKTMREAFLIELKAIDDQSVRAKYHAKLAEKDATIQALLTQLDFKRHEMDREKLIAEAEEDIDANVDVTKTQKVISVGDKTQDQTQEAIDRMKRITAQTEQVGLTTMMQLDKQMEGLKHAEEGYDEIGDNLERFKVTVRGMARSATQDKCIRVLTISIIVCSIILVVLLATR